MRILTNTSYCAILNKRTSNCAVTGVFENVGCYMSNILIAGKNEQVCENIAELLNEAGCSAFSLTDGIRMRSVDAAKFDIIIISTPLSDEFGLDLAAELHRKTDAALIIITKSELCEEIQNKMKFTGAFVIGRPCSKAALQQAIRFAGIAGESIKRLNEEKQRLERQIDDIKIINRAKLCLMQYLKLTEEQAHRHLQKQAMDLRKTQRETAEDILGTYDNLG